MKFTVSVRPGKSALQYDGNRIIISTEEKFRNNMANRDILRQVSDFFEIPESDIRILSGFTSRKKLIEINLY